MSVLLLMSKVLINKLTHALTGPGPHPTRKVCCSIIANDNRCGCGSLCLWHLNVHPAVGVCAFISMCAFLRSNRKCVVHTLCLQSLCHDKDQFIVLLLCLLVSIIQRYMPWVWLRPPEEMLLMSDSNLAGLNKTPHPPRDSDLWLTHHSSLQHCFPYFLGSCLKKVCLWSRYIR